MPWQIRRAITKDIPQLMALFNACTTSPKSEYFFHWWNTIPSGSVTFCAVHDDTVIGMFVVLRRKLNNNLNCGVLMGLLISPEWRGRGLFKELGDTAMGYFEDIDLFCCLTNSIGKKVLEKNFNFRTIDNIQTMCRADEPTGFKLPDHHCIPITTYVGFNGCMKSLDDTLMFSADNEFRHWRFARHPRNSYEMIQMDSGYFAVINKYFDENSGIKYGDIVDFELSILDEQRLTEVINNAYSIVKRDVDVVSIQAVPNHLSYKVANINGFRESNIKHCFCMKVKEPRNNYLYNPSNWLIKWGDYLR